MRPLVSRDLALVTRRRGLIAAALVHAGLVSAFVVAWSEPGRMPLLAGDDLYSQLTNIQWAFMAIAAPWITARVMAGERGAAWSRLAGLTAVSPARLLLARASVISLTLIVVIGSALPPVVLAHQMSHESMRALAIDQLELLAFAMCLGAIALHIELTIRDRLVSWLAATCAGVGMLASAQLLGHPIAAGASAALAVAACALLARRADAHHWYMMEAGT